MRPGDPQHSIKTAKKSHGTPEEAVKYKSYSKDSDPLLSAKWRPSQLIADLQKPTLHARGWRPKPQIVDLLSTDPVQSAVDVDQPLFQPFPSEILFHSYEPFKEYEAVLRLRNNDKVARRVSVEPLDSSFFKVQRQPVSKQVEGSKIAAGMEAVFRIRFTPDSTGSFEQQLVVATERERFLVPVLAVGAAAVLDVPDSIDLPAAAAKKTSKHSFLVRNVGRAAGSFELSTSSSCFAVKPDQGDLAPGEALQLTVEFAPLAAGPLEGELEVLYSGSSRASFTVLRGVGQQLDVGLSTGQQGLQLPKAQMGKLSQRSFTIFNRSSSAVTWGIHQQPSAEAEAAVAYAAVVGTQQQASSLAAGGTCSISGPLIPQFSQTRGGDRALRGLSSHRISLGSAGGSHKSSAASSRCSSGNGRAQLSAGMSDVQHNSSHEHGQLHRPSTASSDGDSSMVSGSSLLGQEQLAALRLAKRARRDIAADKQLFSSPYFSVFPPEGSVNPNSEQEVIVQFSPDSAGMFEALAWVDIQGLGQRLPLQLQGEGQGPVVVLSYGDVLDIGEAFVNMEQHYELELLNRGKVDAEWTLYHSHTRFGSKFSFSPDTGLLPVGQGQLISVTLQSDCLGKFDEAFQLQCVGNPSPLTFNIRGEVVGPQFQLDTQQLDFNIASFGFKYTQQMELTNTGAIPLDFHWHMADETTYTARDFTVLPASGTVLPHASQTIQVEFQPQSVQHYSLSLVMDIPGVMSAATKVAIKGECAVPMIKLAEGNELLQFGDVFVHYPYSQQFTLVNDSKLPAKFEVLQQDQASQSLGSFTAEPDSGSIPAKGSKTVVLSLQAARLGRIQLPVYVRVAGSRNKPLQLVADAKAMGPWLEFAVAPAAAAAAGAPKDAAAGTASESGAAAAASMDGAAASSSGAADASSTAAEAVGVSLNGGSSAVALAPEASSASQLTTVSVTGGTKRTAGRKSKGPKTPAAPQWAGAASIKFDKAQVLQPHTQQLLLRNPTLIDSEVKLFVEGRDSVFEVEPRELVVPAGGDASVVVRVLLDDAAPFKDTLHVLVSEGADVCVPLEATGIGNTVVSAVLSQPRLDFGPQFVGRMWQQEVEVTNMGRKGVTLTWTNKRMAEVLDAINKAAKAAGKKVENLQVPPDQQPVFSISPEKVLVPSKETATFLITGLSNKAGIMSEQLECQAVSSGGNAAGAAGAKPRPVFDISATAEVAAPLLQLSKQAVVFSYIAEDQPPSLMTETLEVRNVSKLPLHFTLKAVHPFGITPAALELQPGDASSVCVSFDPNYRDDQTSHTAKQRCLISYPDNPQKDWLDLTGVVEFPNVVFDTQSIDFGCVLMDSMKRTAIQITNTGTRPVTYSWSWVTQASEGDAGLEAKAADSTQQASSKAIKPLHSQLFDILPIEGTLGPGQTEQVDFSFYAFPGVKATATAACAVKNGPTYEFQLSGESNSIKYDVSPQFFDCGMQPYDRVTDKEFFVINSGKVAFDFMIDLSRLSRPGVIEAHPSTGTVAAGEKARIKLKVKAGVPERLMELALVSVAHFEPVEVQVLVEGTYPILSMNLPRVKDGIFVEALDCARLSSKENELTVTVQKTLDPNQPDKASSPVAGARASFAGVSRGSIGPASMAGTALSGLTAGGRPGSGAKSVISGVSGATGVSGAKSKVSLASAMTAGTILAKDKLAQLHSALKPESRLEIEAERLRLKQLLLKLEGVASSRSASRNGSASSSRVSSAAPKAPSRSTSLKGAAATSNGPQAATSAAPSPGLGATAAGPEAAAGQSVQKRAPVAPKIPELVSGHYLLDFGCVTKGINKSRKVKLTNMSTQQVQFVVDKQTLEAFGFGMMPEAAIKLAGAPECQSMEVTFTVLATKSWVTAGQMELTLPLQIKGGPAVLLTLRALLVVPEVVPSSSTLDFGTVSAGHCKVFTIQLHNPREVPAEWTIKRPAVDSPKLRDWGSFVPEPAEGTLEPGATTKLKILFTPILGREMPYTLPLPIKVANNPKPRDLLCTGRGWTPQVQFSPSVVNCGAVLPKLPGHKPAEGSLVLHNPGDKPVEVVCLDLDSKYWSDEEALRTLDIYNETGVALLRPLAPGEVTWPELLAVAEKQKAAEASAEAALASVTQLMGKLDGQGVLPTAPLTQKQAASGSQPPGQQLQQPGAAPGAPQASTEADAGAADTHAISTDQAPAPADPLVVVVYGPPLAGTSTQASLLGSRYGLPVVCVDGLLQEAYSLEQAEAAAAAAAAAPATPAGTPSSPGRTQKRQLLELLTKLLFFSTPLGPSDFGSPPAPVRGQSATSGHAAAHAAGSAAASAHGDLQPQLQSVPDVITAALQLALQQEQYSKGFIIDGLDSKHMQNSGVVARCLMQALGLVCKAMHPPEPTPPASAGAAKGTKAPSRPPSSRPGVKAAPVPEVVLPIMTFSSPDVWEGLQQVHVVELQLSREEAQRRHQAAAAAEAAGLEVVDLGAEASQSLLGEASFMPQPQQPEDQVSDGQVPAAGAGDGFEASWAAYLQEATRLGLVFGAQPSDKDHVRHRQVPAEVDADAVARGVVGITFKTGVVSAVLPLTPADQDLLPPPYELRVLQQPQKRPRKRALTNFKILTLKSPPPAASVGDSESAGSEGTVPALKLEQAASMASALASTPNSRPASSRGTTPGVAPSEPAAAAAAATPAAPATSTGKSTPRGKSSHGGPAQKNSKAPSVMEEASQEVVVADTRVLAEESGWVIPPNGTINLVVQFASDKVGRFSELLSFDVLCGEKNRATVMAACDYPRINTEARNLYYRTAKVRPSTPNVKQQFILPNSAFEFGPLLCGRDRAGHLTGAYPDHTAKFRITNNGLFRAHADFWLKSEGPAADPVHAAAAPFEAKKKSAPAKASQAGKGAVATESTFILHPSSKDLAMDETLDLSVFAFPTTEGLVEDVIMCRLQDNPTPYEFPISVLGAKPQVAVRLDTLPSAEASENQHAPTGVQRRTSDVGALAKATAKQAVVKGGKAADYTIKFDRLLLNKRDTQAFTISNTGVLPFKWRLAGVAQLPAEFKVYPSEGELAARSKVQVTVEFSALKKQELYELVTLEVMDVADVLGVSRSIPIAIRGEAYDIHIDVKFPQKSFAGVDFGALRVVDDCVKQIVLKNTEKYDVKFTFAITSDDVRQLITITPDTGLLPPGKDATVAVHWNKDLSLKKELSFAGNSDILLSLIEPVTDHSEHVVPIKLSGHAVFSHYAITPAKSLHFGPVTYNTLSKPRFFEVMNTGEFPFTLKVFPMPTKQELAAAAAAVAEKAAAEEAAAAAAKKGAGKAADKGRKGATSSAAAAAPPVPSAPQGALQVGQFTVDPAEAVVKPGCKQQVSVVFRAEANRAWAATLGLDVSERDPRDQHNGIPYELGGDSCIPGIDASNLASIFEEHVVLPLLDPFQPINCSFGLKDKVFNFGTLIAQLPDLGELASPDPGATPRDGGKKGGRPSMSDKQAARASIAPGAAAADGVQAPVQKASAAAQPDTGSLLDDPAAVKANLKFINPKKVPCTVNFSITPTNGAQPGVRFPIEVYPSSIIIPPHEYRHVTLAFCPKALQQYTATFEAVAVGGAADPLTANFVCELRGEGALPSLQFQEPSGFDSAGRPWVKFGKLNMPGQRQQLAISVRNNGFLPAAARIEMDQHPAFKLLEGTQVFSVESKKAATFTVEFTPQELGTFSHELQLRVNSNPFEQYKVALTGECAEEELVFLGLPPGGITLPDVHLAPPTPTAARPPSSLAAHKEAPSPPAPFAGAALSAAAGLPVSQVPPGSSSSSFTFTMANNSSSKHFRYKWPDHPHLKFYPSVGHLHAGQVRDVTVTFVASAPVRLDRQDIKLALSQITYKGDPLVWDEAVAANMVASGLRCTSATRVAMGLPGAQPKPGAEPLVDLVPRTQRDMALKVSAVADSPRYECSAPSPAIVFKPTMMFQTRSFTFTLSNPSLTVLTYQWQILDKAGNQDTSGLYTLSHESGTLQGGSSQQITLRFSPQEVEDAGRVLVCHMPELQQALAAAPSMQAPAGRPGSAAAAAAAAAAATKPLTREVMGKVLRPWCHFELPESDYVTGGRRNPDLPGPSGVLELLDPATKVVEFESLGIRVRNTRRFFILNPTSITYEFVWAPMLPPAVAALGGPPPPSPFNCVVRKGTISEGRRYEMVFEYTPTTDTLIESFWSFSIPSQGLVVPFLLVGHVTEPRVTLDRPAINFGRVQLGMRTKLALSLYNDENLPFSFALDKASYDASDALLAASGGKPLLEVHPVSGTVPPKSKIDLVATYAPQEERPINYNVIVRVRNKPTPLQLNVKGEGYALAPSLLLELPDDSSLELSNSGVNTVDFGQVVINDRVVRSLSLSNPGRVNFDYTWDLGNHPRMSVKPAAGSVPKGERRVIELNYAPTATEQLAGHRVRCQVINGPTYHMALNGTGYKPKLNLSFLSYDFGPCHVFQQGMTPAAAKLVIVNEDRQPVSCDAVFDNTENWQVTSTPSLLQPGQRTEIGITFVPTAAKEYATAMPLRVMGLYDINVPLRGEGVPLMVEVAKAEQNQRGVMFGPVPCGSCCNRVLPLINRGRAAAQVSFAPSAELLQQLGIEVIPSEGVLLKPKQTAELTLMYRPQQRTRPFKEPLKALVAGVPQIITTLSGACTGLSVVLASDSIPFGTVVLGSRTTKRLLLSNNGDLGCKFAWDTTRFGSNFSITPAEGFLAPGQDVKLEVSFHPAAVNPDIRLEQLRCKLSGSAAPATAAADASAAASGPATMTLQKLPDLHLNLTGACAPSEATGEPVVFKCMVRTSTSKSIKLQNPTSSNWQLRPVINNDFWTGAEFLQVPAGGSAEYALCYKPLTMTPAEGQPHQGSVFFPLPDGSGLLHILHGQADQPTPEGVIELTLPAKTQHTQTLKVSNWLHKPQRFRVIKELLAGEASTSLEGAGAIDVPALLDREYRLNMFSYTQGLTHARITFKNEASGEYTYYEVKLTSTAPAPMGRLSLECPVRNQTSATVSITNPLDVPVTLKPSITSKQVCLVPAAPLLPPKVTTPLEVRFRPLLLGSSEASLKLDSAQLGLYEWKLKLTGAPTMPERPLTFSVPLGTREVQVLHFLHWGQDRAEYKCSFKSSSGSTGTSGGVAASSTDFDAPASVVAPPAGPTGTDIEVAVGFEPCVLGEAVRDTLVLTSATSGVYEVPLMGQCVPPKPQGPIDISKGSAVVPFRNVFAVEAEFVYSTDNPAFVLGRSSEKLPPKKPSSISVSYKPSAGGGSRMAKLTVSCPKQTSTQWVYYLQA